MNSKETGLGLTVLTYRDKGKKRTLLPMSECGGEVYLFPQIRNYEYTQSTSARVSKRKKFPDLVNINSTVSSALGSGWQQFVLHHKAQ